MYKKLYHTVTEQIGIEVVGVDACKKATRHFYDKGFQLVASSKPYDLSNITTMTFEKRLESIENKN